MSKRQRANHEPTDGSIARRLKTRRRRQRLSPLEQLPTEILQQILIYSLNPDLPLASRQLSQCLTSLHLMEEMLYQAWAQYPPVWDSAASSNNEGALAVSIKATLVQRKFFTWPVCWDISTRLAALIKKPNSGLDLEYYKVWQEEEWRVAPNNVRQETDAQYFAYWENCEAFCWFWDRQTSGDGYMMPLRLLRGPWSQDSREMLAFFADMDYGVQCVANRPQVIKGIYDAVRFADTVALGTLIQSMSWPFNDAYKNDHYAWLPPLITETFLRQPGRSDLHEQVIDLFIQKRPRYNPLSAAGLLERETWDWLDANYRVDNHARRLKTWIEMYDAQNPVDMSMWDTVQYPIRLREVGVDVTSCPISS